MAEWVEKGSIKGPPGEIPDVSDFLRDNDVSSAISGSSDKVASDKAVKDYVDSQVTELSSQVSAEATARQEQDSSLQTQIGGKANVEHSHEMDDVTGLNDKISEIETSVSGKANATHTHTTTQVDGLDTKLSEIDDDIAAKADAVHKHAIADVTNLQTTLDGKAASVHTHEIANVNGLQDALGSKAAASHEHSADNITSGTLSIDRIPNIPDAKIDGMSATKLTGTVPQANLPSYVDDVVEHENFEAFPPTGESGKIYVDTTTNKTYRWSGSTYVEISASLALGETESTAFRGDYGKVAYQHAQAKGSQFASGLYKVETNAEGHVVNATAVTKSDITNLGIPAQDTTYVDATGSASGLMSAEDKTKLDGLENVDMTGYAKVVRNYSNALQDDEGWVGTLMITEDPVMATNFVQIRTDGDKPTFAMNTMEVNGFTDTITPNADGYSLATDKAVKDYVDANKTVVTVDDELSDSSTNPVQNKVIKEALDGKAASTHNHDDRYYTETEIDSKLDGKANASHTHTFDSSMSDSSVNAVQNKVVNAALAGKVPTTRTINGKPLSANVTLSASDVGADATGAASDALTQAKSYADTKISALVNSAPETLDTLGELAAAMTENADAIESLESIAASKANASDLTSHTGNSTVHITSTDRTNWNAAKTHADSPHAPSNAEPNQNAFSNVKVDDQTIAADTKTDTLIFAAGSNVTITPNVENDTVTIAAKDTTYSVATTGANGLMSSADKAKLDGIASGANKYTHPTSAAGAKASGLYKITTDANGHITAATAVTKSDITALGIPAQDTNTTYNNATTSTDGLMSSEDKTKLNGISTASDEDFKAYMGIS